MSDDPVPRRVALFVSCIADLAAPGPARAAVELLEALGCEVTVPVAQTCCGQVALNSGHRDEATRLMRRWLRVFEAAEAVVSPSGSCVATVCHQYPRVLDGLHRDTAHDVAARTYELSQFLARYGAGLSLRLAGTVTYHDSCHMLRSLGERSAPRVVLGRVADLHLVEMAEASVCCGFGGTFASTFPAVSVAMGDQKLAAAERTGTDWLVSADPGCLMHLGTRAAEMGAAVRTRHLAELLAAALAETGRGR